MFRVGTVIPSAHRCENAYNEMFHIFHRSKHTRKFMKFTSFSSDFIFVTEKQEQAMLKAVQQTEARTLARQKAWVKKLQKELCKLLGYKPNNTDHKVNKEAKETDDVPDPLNDAFISGNNDVQDKDNGNIEIQGKEEMVQLAAEPNANRNEDNHQQTNLTKVTLPELTNF